MTNYGSCCSAQSDQQATTIAEKAGQAWRQAEHFAGSAAQSAENAWEEVNGFVRRYPITVFLGGFAVGFLVREALRDYPSDMTRRMSQSSA